VYRPPKKKFSGAWQKSKKSGRKREGIRRGTSWKIQDKLGNGKRCGLLGYSRLRVTARHDLSGSGQKKVQELPGLKGEGRPGNPWGSALPNTSKLGNHIGRGTISNMRCRQEGTTFVLGRQRQPPAGETFVEVGAEEDQRRLKPGPERKGRRNSAKNKGPIKRALIEKLAKCLQKCETRVKGVRNTTCKKNP